MEITLRILTIRLVPEDGRQLAPWFSVYIRSMLGSILRKKFCIFPDRICDDCPLNRNCGYAVVFESIGEKDGTRRKEHPYSFSFDGKTLRFTLLGSNGIRFSRAILETISEMGKSGIGPKGSRIRFRSHLMEEKDVSWASGEAKQYLNENILITFDTPIRMQNKGRIIDDFDLTMLLRALFRRAAAICTHYGSGDIPEYVPPEIQMEKHAYRWIDWGHYSQRQEIFMKLGGVEGTIEAEAMLSALDSSLLDFGALAGAGKNTAFGLGAMEWGRMIQS